VLDIFVRFYPNLELILEILHTTFTVHNFTVIRPFGAVIDVCGRKVMTKIIGASRDCVNALLTRVSWSINLLKTKRKLLYLKAQFVPRSELSSTRLQKPSSWWWTWHKLLFVLK
jgi:hypothetical protein